MPLLRRCECVARLRPQVRTVFVGSKLSPVSDMMCSLAHCGWFTRGDGPRQANTGGARAARYLGGAREVDRGYKYRR
jgi:hypothetical protein